MRGWVRRPGQGTGRETTAADAQQAERVYRIGYLTSGSGPSDWTRAFRETMRELGYIEGQNLVIEYRWAAGKLDQLPRLAAELVDLKVDVIVASPTTGVLAAKQATRTIPIVFPVSVDALRAGIVDSLAHPSGNVTGLTLVAADMIAKRVEFLRIAVPTASRLAFLSVGGIPAITAPLVKELETATRARRMTLRVVELSSFEDADFDRAFAAIAKSGADALYVLDAPTIAARAGHVMRLALRYRLPVVGTLREYADAGAVLFYGPNVADMHRRAAVMVARMLRGARPADLPVEQPTKFELVVNMRTAKALGLSIPSSLLLRADEVME